MSTSKRRMDSLPLPPRPEPASMTCSIWSFFSHKGVAGRGIVSGWPGRPHTLSEVHGELTGERRVEMHFIHE